jgi:hypothetical protein
MSMQWCGAQVDLTKWNDFLWRKHDPKHSMSMDEINFDGWIPCMHNVQMQWQWIFYEHEMTQLLVDYIYIMDEWNNKITFNIDGLTTHSIMNILIQQFLSSLPNLSLDSLNIKIIYQYE